MNRVLSVNIRSNEDEVSFLSQAVKADTAWPEPVLRSIPGDLTLVARLSGNRKAGRAVSSRSCHNSITIYISPLPQLQRQQRP